MYFIVLYHWNPLTNRQYKKFLEHIAIHKQRKEGGIGMSGGFSCLLQIFPTLDINKTTKFYEEIGFRAVYYLDSSEPHVCLYRDKIEVILTKSKNDTFSPNRLVHGYGYDAYFIADNHEEIYNEFEKLGIKIVRPLERTDYENNEFVFEDADGRWIAVGKKQI
jgi:catechol 2,3-dioxygenase-like lactoylglutathione lyase family enzyme